MPIGRVGRPGLVGTMARTAVIAGTAQAVAGGTAHRQQQRWANQQAQEDQAALEAQQMAQMQAQLQAQAAAAPPADDLMTKLQQLADLKNAGVLSDAEFAAAKAKLLA